MADFNHYEFYKDLYFKENERRTDLENSLNIPFAIITALVAGIYILATTFPYSSAENAITYIFEGLMGGTALSLAGAVYFIILVYGDSSGFFRIFNPNNTFSYRGIPYAQSLFNWHENLLTFYNQQPPTLPNTAGVVPTPQVQADDDLKEYLIDQFVVATNHNTFVNDQKLADIYWAKKLLIISLIINFLALFPYMQAFLKKKDEVHKVELQNKIYKIEIQKLDSLKSTGNMRKAAIDSIKRQVDIGRYLPVEKSVPVKVDSVTGRPCPPEGRVIKEGQYPEKPLNYKK